MVGASPPQAGDGQLVRRLLSRTISALLTVCSPIQKATSMNNALHPEKLASYLLLAEAALPQYGLGPADITFVQHNAGIVFHVITRETEQNYVLKLYQRVGIGADPTPEALEPGLHWLADFAQSCNVMVQTPIRTRTGQFVGQVVLPSTTTPVACTVQHWVDGRLPNGDFTAQQIYTLGKMTAKIHAFSSTYVFTTDVSATHHDSHALHTNIRLLRATLPDTLLSAHDYTTIRAAAQRIVEYMAALGQSSVVWGPVHGDLHYDNILLYGEDIRPLDFTGLRVAHYLYDIGVTMYHIFHQGSTVRHSYFVGYQEIYPLPSAYQEYIEAFITYAAIDDVAWNCTIPEQRESSLFQQNLNNLIHTYCTSLAERQPFLFV
jgi:Ser/Thr protein kinase RdoA (MazF antagonist)